MTSFVSQVTTEIWATMHSIFHSLRTAVFRHQIFMGSAANLCVNLLRVGSYSFPSHRI